MKKALSFILALTLSMVLAVPALADINTRAPIVMPSNQKLTVNGELKEPEVYNIDGSNYFKLRDMAMLLNGTGSQFSVDFDAERSTIVVKTGVAYTPVGGELEVGEDKSDTAVESQQSIEINGQMVDLPAFNIGGNNFFKIVALCEAIGFDVEYDPKTATIVVLSVDTNVTKSDLDNVLVDIRPSESKAPLSIISEINGKISNSAQNEQNALYMCQAAMTASSAYYGKYYAERAQEYYSKITADIYDAVQLCGDYDNLNDLKVPLATIYGINSYGAAYSITSSNYLSYAIETSTQASELTVYYEQIIGILQNVVNTYK